MKRTIAFLAASGLIGLLVTVVSPQPVRADLFGGLGDWGQAQQRFEDQLANLAAALTATPVAATVKSFTVGTGGFQCGTDAIKSADTKSVVVNSGDGKSFVVTANSEERLRTIVSTIEASMLANLNVTFLANNTGCPANTYNAMAVTVTK
jgi:hypothetical protein